MISTDDIDEQAQGWFVRLNDADASEAEWLSFQDWLEADAAHPLAYARVEQLWLDLDTVPASALPANDDFGGARRVRPTWIYPLVGLAAAVALTVGIWPAVFGNGAQIYHTASEPRTVELADGSMVYMNRHSDLSVDLSGARREVALTNGEAAFDVAHNADRPFVITAGDHNVEVLGTAFNVVNHDDRFSVSVQRGVVAVTSAKSRAPVRLTVGQQIDQVGEQNAVLSRVDPANASIWRSGALVYSNAPLGRLADDLSRYLDKPVNVSASAQTLRFTGVLRVGDEATMLGQLRELVPVEVSRSPDGVELTRRETR
jgi:transmembrane sensor